MHSTTQSTSHLFTMATELTCLTSMLPLPCRLTSLPPSVLWHIARKMGRRSRIVSRALRDAYGPLGRGLQLPGGAYWDGLSQLPGLLVSRGQCLRHLNSLQLLHPRGQNCARAGVLACIVEELPHLESLSLHLSGPELPLLAPLRSTLTALSVHLDACRFATAAMTEGLEQLTGLRSLTLAGPGSPATGMRDAWQYVPSNLPQLLHLSWFVGSGFFVWTPQWLVRLGCSMPQLTSLCLGHPLAPEHAWKECTAPALQRAVASLRVLPFKARAGARDDESGAAVDAMVAQLLACCGIECVHMALHVAAWTPPPDLLQLCSLPLASLDVVIERPGSGSQLQPLLLALPSLSRLTRLNMSIIGCSPWLVCPQLPISLVEVQLEGDWEPSSVLPPLQALPELRVLALHGMCPIAAKIWLSTLTQLHSLALIARGAQSLSWAIASLAELTALQALRLDNRDAVHNRRSREATALRLTQLASLQELRNLSLNFPWEVQGLPASCMLDALEALPNLQQLELRTKPGHADALEALVGGMLPLVLPRLTCFKLLGGGLPERVVGTLLSAAKAHGCTVVT
jgi:hypothetical protein